MGNFDEIFNATLTSQNLIEVHIHKKYTQVITKHFYLYLNDNRVCELKIQDQRETNNHFHYVLSGVPEIKVGAEYKIYDDRYLFAYLDVSVLLKNEKICSKYYSDEIMGAHYHKYYTTFRLFSPLASQAYVIYELNNKEYIFALEKNEETGIFKGRVTGDLSGAKYYFSARINGKLVHSVDPNARCLTAQSTKGIIIDPSKVNICLNEDDLPPFNNPSEAIIYEMSVRDMTISKTSPFKYKGKFLGLTESGLKSKDNNPVGIDYIKELGITHVQLQPIYDFCTVNDLNQKEAYNWGYDPLFYNVPEGSFASSPKDPLSRIIDLKKMVASFHKEGIRVVMDVVYNHVFNLESSCFEILCPSYYFRFKDDGSPSNGSFCGNEFNSNHLMARKFIIDSCLYWVKEFGIDGFRFDLMGLIDIDTINEVKEKCEAIKPGFLVYGEGWDLPSTLLDHKKTKLANSFKTPEIGFFNDRFRDIVKGKTGDYELGVKGYLTGDYNYIDGFKHCYLGSCIPLAFPPLFRDASQSINFVECHDNATLFDKITISNFYESKEQWLKRVKIINAITIFSFGIPFIHAGQEFGISKNGVTNSYNAGDDINKFDYDLMDERYQLVKYVKDAIKLRKMGSFFKLTNKEDIAATVEFKNLPEGALLIEYNGEKIAPLNKVLLIVNPTYKELKFNFDKEAHIIFDDNGLSLDKKLVNEVKVLPISLIMAIVD